MNIQKPQKILTENLAKIENLLDEIKDTEEFENIIIEDYKNEKISFNDITILFSYDEKLKCSNSKGFLLSTI